LLWKNKFCWIFRKKIQEFQKYLGEISSMKENVLENSKKNKRKSQEPQNEDFLENIEKVTTKNEFLRIQLGDQTDSKVLLGQYRCTDVTIGRPRFSNSRCLHCSHKSSKKWFPECTIFL
jgi:hypothetical protein